MILKSQRRNHFLLSDISQFSLFLIDQILFKSWFECHDECWHLWHFLLWRPLIWILLQFNCWLGDWIRFLKATAHLTALPPSTLRVGVICLFPTSKVFSPVQLKCLLPVINSGCVNSSARTKETPSLTYGRRDKTCEASWLAPPPVIPFKVTLIYTVQRVKCVLTWIHRRWSNTLQSPQL